MPNINNFSGEFETGQVTVGLTPVQLPNVQCKTVMLRAIGGGNIVIGASDTVTITTGLTIEANTRLLVPLPVDNLSQIWAVSNVAGHTVEFLVQR